MNKLISVLSVVLFSVVSAFSQTPAEGAMLFSKGCASYQYPIVFVYQNGNMRTSDFQASTKTVASWGKFNETHFYVKTTAVDSFYCVILPISYSGMGWVNKKQPTSYFNGVYYNAKRDSIFLMDYPNRNAIDFIKSDMSGGVTVSPINYRYGYEGNQGSWYDHICFGSKTLCYNRLANDPFCNVFEILDSLNQPASADNQWVCADKRTVPDSFDSLNCGVNFYYGVNFFDYNGEKGFLVVTSTDQNNYEFVSVDGKRYVVPWLLQDSANQYRNAVMASWGWATTYAKPVSVSYLDKYALSSNVPVSYNTNSFLLKNKNFGKKWEVVGMWSLKEISDSAALANYGANWQSKLVEVPDVFLANYTITGSSTKISPRQMMKPSSLQKISAQSITYDVMGRKIANVNRSAVGLSFVRSQDGTTMVKNINVNRLR
jgi:hypothetical protein